MAVNFVISPAVQSVLEELEIQRKKIVSTNYKGWGLILGGILLAFPVTNFGGLIAGLLVGAAAVIPGGVMLYKISDDTAQYKSRFKKEVVGAALSSVDQCLTLDPTNGISEAEFTSSQLFTTGIDRYHTEDLICGKVDKTSFYFAEVHAEYKTETRTKNGTQTTWHDILKGIVFTADFNKNFNGVTVVRPKDFGSSIGAWFSKNIFSVGDKNVVELENDGFNKNFVTYSTDQVEARYILTPAMMERINDLNQRSAYTVSLSFINSSMYVAFPLDKNYFEAPVYKTLLRADLLDDDISILGFMYDIVHELDLNTRIWTKQ
ncbi:DUF3137 domain-containing protein [Pedobacter frigiditerrae]|uniref:DUF3137 domain-containing protein n=1 Tax=Pedobacter frigiditerrae TaxID=2530452 RepID=A0A4R0N1H2_9SPHI|nr:DUF3137 domain-containing protein [Pedobacter frigiditerrae]TCC93560.1 DUF3137 domain-containing protein [Pedobacter frigiditerrae]